MDPYHFWRQTGQLQALCQDKGSRAASLCLMDVRSSYQVIAATSPAFAKPSTNRNARIRIQVRDFPRHLTSLNLALCQLVSVRCTSCGVDAMEPGGKGASMPNKQQPVPDPGFFCDVARSSSGSRQSNLLFRLCMTPTWDGTASIIKYGPHVTQLIKALHWEPHNSATLIKE